MKEQPQLFDICIVCALYEEASAVIEEFSRRCHVSFTKAYHGLDRYEYQYTTMQNTSREPLTVLVTWLPEMGPPAMAQEIKSFVQQFHPRFMAMTGICAGDQRQVQLGDLIIASAAYHYEEGKITGEPEGHLPATHTTGPANQVLQYVRGFTGWEQPVTQMKQLLLKRPLQAADHPKQKVAPMASGMAVRADDPFPWLQQRYHRHTVALDMEAASFYSALRSFTHTLVVKGVCDYADIQKNDDYHDYAARVSAVYMLHFIQEYVTEQTMPRITPHSPIESALTRHDASTQLDQIIQNFKLLRSQIANYVHLKGPKGFNLESCESQYNKLYGDTMVFLATYLPENVSDDAEGFVAIVQRKSAVELYQRSNFSVSLARLVIAPLANFEKLAAQIDACATTLESYKQKYFTVSGRSS